MLQPLLGKKVVLPQSLGETECLAKKINALFVSKIETALISLPITSVIELKDSHKLS